MLKTSLDRYRLEQEVQERRNTLATYEQEQETRQLGFRHTRVLLSKTRLRAEAYLQQN
jgi:hypothetical protein